jgi:hypothetical protein
MGVLSYLTDQRLAVTLGHPVFGFDLDFFADLGQKLLLQLFVINFRLGTCQLVTDHQRHPCDTV